LRRYVFLYVLLS